MPDTPSEDSLIRGLNEGRSSAAGKLDRQYGPKIRAMAQRGMDPKLRRREDPEDVAQSVLRTVLCRAAKGELQFGHAGGLWALLEKVTRRKILKHAEHHKAKKRTPRREEYPDPDRLFARKPTAEESVVARDLIEEILEGLDQEYGKILLLLAEGHSERAVAAGLGCTRRAVSTKLDRLRKRLTKLLDKENS